LRIVMLAKARNSNAINDICHQSSTASRLRAPHV
jgi:hypothetical protein